VFFLVAQLIITCVSSRYLAAALPFFVMTFYAIQHFYLRTSRQLRLLDIELKAPLYTQLMETLNGLVTIRAFQWEDRFTQKALVILDDSRRPGYLLMSIQCWLMYAIDMVIMLVAVAFIIITTTLREHIGPSYMGIGLSSVLGLSGSAKTFITFWVLLEVALGAVARIRSFTLNTESEKVHSSSSSDTAGKEWPSRGSIELHNVVSTYP
jgi:ATP-binding cassette subfamily C (CFTR/MRP) protein 1